MCECEDEPDDTPAPLTSALIARMRMLERSLDGERVSEECWSVFLGRAAGSIPFGAFMRLARCRQTVMNFERRSRSFNSSRHRRRSPVALPPAASSR